MRANRMGKRVSIYIPHADLPIIDAAADRCERSRSDYITKAATFYAKHGTPADTGFTQIIPAQDWWVLIERSDAATETLPIACFGLQDRKTVPVVWDETECSFRSVYEILGTADRIVQLGPRHAIRRQQIERVVDEKAPAHRTPEPHAPFPDPKPG